jgi:hypothetical protein
MIENYKEKNCRYCDNKHICSDLDGDVLDEAVKVCIDAGVVKVKITENDLEELFKCLPKLKAEKDYLYLED